MYLRAAHAELHIPTLRQLIHSNPLGILTTAIPSPQFPLLQCSHIPWLLDVSDHFSETELGTLRAHMARANPHAKAIIESAKSSNPGGDGKHQLEQDVMILFNAPVQHYVTPKFYVETKPATGKVVPTWNYAAAQAYGKATIYFDSSDERTAQFLSKQVDDLTRMAETEVMGHFDGNVQGKKGDEELGNIAWKVSDAPARYVDLLMKSIIGIEVQVTDLQGKFKMSQELPNGDRKGVVQGFEGMGTELGAQTATTVKERGELKDERARNYRS